jgi:hypothetical protein
LRSIGNILRRIFTAISHLHIVRELDLLKCLISNILSDAGVALIPFVVGVDPAEIYVSTAGIHGLTLFRDFDRLSLGVQEKFIDEVEVVAVIIDLLIVKK